MFQNEIEKLTKFGLSLDILNEYDLVILPENFDEAESIEELYDTDDSIYLVKDLKDKNIKCASFIDLKSEIPFKERRGGDIWLGTSWVLNNLLLPLYLNILSNYIFEYIGNKKSKSVNFEKQNVHLKIKIKEEKTFSKFEYDGDSETLLKILKLNDDSSN